MNAQRFLTGGIALLLIGACAPPETPTIDMPVFGDTSACAAKNWQSAVGKPFKDLAEPPEHTRVITPGSAITMDYRSNRMNIDLDDKARVVRVWCG